jgi:hypothetical protein
LQNANLLLILQQMTLLSAHEMLLAKLFVSFYLAINWIALMVLAGISAIGLIIEYCFAACCLGLAFWKLRRTHREMLSRPNS